MSQPRHPQIKPLSDPDWSGEWISVLAMGEKYEYTISWSGRSHELRVMKNDEKPRRLVAKGAWFAPDSAKNVIPDVLPEMRAKILERMPVVWDFYLRKCACN